ncbi:MAG: hypothetical protein AB7P99_14190, partial [Vicinamibacterales bacterium]
MFLRADDEALRGLAFQRRLERLHEAEIRVGGPLLAQLFAGLPRLTMLQYRVWSVGASLSFE